MKPWKNQMSCSKMEAHLFCRTMARIGKFICRDQTYHQVCQRTVLAQTLCRNDSSKWIITHSRDKVAIGGFWIFVYVQNRHWRDPAASLRMNGSTVWSSAPALSSRAGKITQPREQVTSAPKVISLNQTAEFYIALHYMQHALDLPSCFSHIL